MFKKVMASPRTSVAGILGFLAIVSMQLKASFDNDPTTITDWNVIVEAIAVLGIGLAARDNGVTSEEAGAR